MEKPPERKFFCHLVWAVGVPAGRLSCVWDLGSELILLGRTLSSCRDRLLLDTRVGPSVMICTDISSFQSKEATCYRAGKSGPISQFFPHPSPLTQIMYNLIWLLFPGKVTPDRSYFVLLPRKIS